MNAALRRLHRATIGSLALCALVIGIASLTREAAPREEVGRLYSWIALALAGTAIVARRSFAGTGVPRRPAAGAAQRPGPAPTGRPPDVRTFVIASLLHLIAAAGLGVLGIGVALREAQGTVGLLYTLAGTLLALRPPAALPAAPSAGS